jgi:hypothetical protein
MAGRATSHFTVKEVDGFVLATSSVSHHAVQRLLASILVSFIQQGSTGHVYRWPCSGSDTFSALAGVCFGITEVDPEHKKTLDMLDALVPRTIRKQPVASAKKLLPMELQLATSKKKCKEWASLMMAGDLTSAASSTQICHTIWYMTSELRADMVLCSVRYLVDHGVTTMDQLPVSMRLLIGTMSIRDRTISCRLPFWASSGSHWDRFSLSATTVGMTEMDATDSKRSGGGIVPVFGTDPSWWIILLYNRLKRTLALHAVSDTFVDSLIRVGFAVFVNGAIHRWNREDYLNKTETLSDRDKSEFIDACRMRHDPVYTAVIDTALVCRDLNLNRSHRRVMTAELEAEIRVADSWSVASERVLKNVGSKTHWKHRAVEHMSLDKFRTVLITKCGAVDLLVEHLEALKKSSSKPASEYVYLMIRDVTAADVRITLDDMRTSGKYTIVPGVDNHYKPLVYLAIERAVFWKHQAVALPLYVEQTTPTEDSHAATNHRDGTWTRMTLMPLYLSLFFRFDDVACTVMLFETMRRYAGYRHVAFNSAASPGIIRMIQKVNMALNSADVMPYASVSTYVKVAVPLLAIFPEDGLRYIGGVTKDLPLLHVEGAIGNMMKSDATAWEKYRFLFAEFTEQPNEQKLAMLALASDRFQLGMARVVGASYPEDRCEAKDMHSATHIGLQKSHRVESIPGTNPLHSCSGSCDSADATIFRVVLQGLESTHCGGDSRHLSHAGVTWMTTPSAPCLASDSKRQCMGVYTYPFGCVTKPTGEEQWLYHDRCFLVRSVVDAVEFPRVASWRLEYLHRVWYSQFKQEIDRYSTPSPSSMLMLSTPPPSLVVMLPPPPRLLMPPPPPPPPIILTLDPDDCAVPPPTRKRVPRPILLSSASVTSLVDDFGFDATSRLNDNKGTKRTKK